MSLSKKVVDTVKSLLESDDIVLTTETAMMTGFYPTWHKDTTTQERAWHTFHKNPDYKMVRCGIYLQDTDDLGGLSVIAGSHVTPDNFPGGDFLPKRTLFFRIKNKVIPYNESRNKKLNPHKLKIIDIPSKMGDFVFFNFQTAHKGTLPKSQRVGDVGQIAQCHLTPKQICSSQIWLPPLHAAWRGGCSPGDSREDGGEVSAEMQFVLHPE